MKRLLLTGSDGFTGGHFHLAAEAAGYHVNALKSDLTDAKAVAAEIAQIQPEYVVHLAALSAVTHPDEQAFYHVNLFGTQFLLTALCELQVRPKKVLLASSANVYGNSDATKISEAVCPKPVNHYAISKLAMEYMATTYTVNLPIVIARPFNYTGIGHDTRFVIPKIIEHFKSFAGSIALGSLDVYREYNDVRMVCDAYLKLLEVDIACGIYNICTGRTYSLREVLSMLEKITAHKIDVQVNQDFVRKNEVISLSGDPRKIQSVAPELKVYDLESTLAWMLGHRSISSPKN
jgi:nucleoside-diphosphate-sugar epimerase